MIRNGILVVLLFISGCAVLESGRAGRLESAVKQKDILIAEQAEMIAKKNNEISALQSLLAERDGQVAQKDEELKNLRRRLESFGVFQ